MSSMFKNAFFGKMYQTRNEQKAVYIRSVNDSAYHHQLVLDNGDIELYNNFGKRSYGGIGLDIVSEL